MAVAGVFTETDIGDNQDVGNLVLDTADGLLNDAVLGKGAGGQFVFFVGNPEKKDGRNPQVLRFLDFLEDVIDGHLEIAGHGMDWFFSVFAGDNKEGINQIVNG